MAPLLKIFRVKTYNLCAYTLYVSTYLFLQSFYILHIIFYVKVSFFSVQMFLTNIVFVNGPLYTKSKLILRAHISNTYYVICAYYIIKNVREYEIVIKKYIYLYTVKLVLSGEIYFNPGKVFLHTFPQSYRNLHEMEILPVPCDSASDMSHRYIIGKIFILTLFFNSGFTFLNLIGSA